MTHSARPLSQSDGRARPAGPGSGTPPLSRPSASHGHALASCCYHRVPPGPTRRTRPPGAGCLLGAPPGPERCPGQPFPRGFRAASALAATVGWAARPRLLTNTPPRRPPV